MLGPGGPTSKRRAAGSPTNRRPDLESRPFTCTGVAAVLHLGGRRELLRSAMLQPHAPAWQPLKVDSKAASDSHLPPRECSLGSGCAMDESQGVSTQSSTLRARGRAGKLTWAGPSVGKHGAAAPAIAGARTLPSSAGSATLLQARRLAPPLLLERLVRFKSDLNSYLEHVALQI